MRRTHSKLNRIKMAIAEDVSNMNEYKLMGDGQSGVGSEFARSAVYFGTKQMRTPVKLVSK